jgi:hypothetical protein
LEDRYEGKEFRGKECDGVELLKFVWAREKMRGRDESGVKIFLEHKKSISNLERKWKDNGKRLLIHPYNKFSIPQK